MLLVVSAFESPDHDAVAVAVIVRGGSVLLVRRRATDNAPPWVLPGGKIAPGESPGQAAVREALEETGIETAQRRVLGSRVHPDTGKRITYVACDVITGTARVAAPRELVAVEWVPIGELGKYVPHGFFAPVQRHLAALMAT
jgi:8-oxo-dGTP diphosphatase